MKFAPRIPVLACLSLIACTSAVADLKSYVNKPDDSYSFSIQSSVLLGNTTVYVIRMTSQTWHDITWQHWLTVYRPQEIRYPDKAMMLISGGDNTDEGPRIKSGEARTLQMIAEQTGTVTAVLNQVPNQPLFNGLKEDGIIALTFDKYLNGEGDDWPLLFPMVKSAVRGMDTVQQVAQSEFQTEIKHFMTLGGSKRGWTTWLSAVADDRVMGIAPVVIDMLNMVPQAELQLMSYGRFSDEIKDYTDRNIQARMNSDEGAKLRAQVDPFSYCDSLTLPKLVVLGTNDPYWNVDSSTNYFPYLKGEKHLYYCANTPHDVNPGGVGTIIAFYKSLLTGEKLPTIAWDTSPDGTIKVQWEHNEGKAKVWSATSPNRDFRGSEWTAQDLDSARSANVRLGAPEQGWIAYYVEVIQPGPGGAPFGLCTTTTVLPNTFPFPDGAQQPVIGTNSGN